MIRCRCRVRYQGSEGVEGGVEGVGLVGGRLRRAGVGEAEGGNEIGLYGCCFGHDGSGEVCLGRIEYGDGLQGVQEALGAGAPLRDGGGGLSDRCRRAVAGGSIAMARR